MPHNSLFIHCDTSKHSKLNKTSREKEVNGYFTEPRIEKLEEYAIEKKYTKRGVYLRPSASYKVNNIFLSLHSLYLALVCMHIANELPMVYNDFQTKLRKFVQKQNMEKEISRNRHVKFRKTSSSLYPDFIYTSSYEYARLGW